MVEELENLVLEHLRNLRADMNRRFDGIAAVIRDLADQQRATNAHIVGLVRHDAFASDKFAEIETRIERIERRLELRDEP